ncbi:MAG: DsbA family protein [Myxococcales bacterium]
MLVVRWSHRPSSVPQAPSQESAPAKWACASWKRSNLGRTWKLSLWLPALALAIGCAAPSQQRSVERRADVTKVAPAVILRASEILPVYPEDLGIGSRSAPVTVVAFLDLECPYCARGYETILRVQKRFGSDQVRIVIKHLPLPFHSHATPAARTVLELQRSHGDEAALAFLNRVFTSSSELNDATLQVWAEQATRPSSQNAVSMGRVFGVTVEEQLQRDAQLAARHGIDGTPEFRINGISLTGALAEEEFERTIRDELALVKQLLERGMPEGDVYAHRVAKNHVPKATEDATPKADPVRWAIPLSDSPQLGSSAAPVTIVAFMDYECPFCQRGFETVKQLRAKYRDQIRVVWRHRPLEFHPHAAAASSLAILIRRNHGDEAFWSTTDQLFAKQDALSDLATLPVVGSLRVDLAQLQQRNFVRLRDQVLSADSDVADDFGVEGTPQFFVNGWRIKGARPIEDFCEIIDRELTAAKGLRDRGIKDSELYSALMAEAKPAPAPPTIAEAASFPEGPSLGPAKAKVTIRVFSDYQCPFCQRAESTLSEVRKKYPADVRIVWYDLPLSFHERARPAATLARELRARRGDEAFFQANHWLFEHQSNLSEAALLGYAKSVGVQADALAEERREQAHGAIIDRDRKLAEDLHITGTPSFVIGRYLLEGAQPASRFERLIRRVLTEQSTARQVGKK